MPWARRPGVGCDVGGVGTKSCAKSTQNVRDLVIAPGNISWEDFAFAWALGWLSRKNVERETSGLAPMTDLTPESFGSKDQQAFMGSYCAANPQRNYVDGVDEIFQKLPRIYSLVS